MQRLPLLVGVLTVALAGCLEPQPIEPGPSTGSWIETEASPWFAYEANAGFCGPVCFAAAVVFHDGGTLWVTWGGMHGWDQDDDARAWSGSAPAMRAADEPYRSVVRDALLMMNVEPDVRVYDVATQTMSRDDHERIQERILDNVNGATHPGNATYACTDVGAPRVVVHAETYWDVRVASRDDDCITMENPQAAWFRVHDQGHAVWRWIHQEGWTDPQA